MDKRFLESAEFYKRRYQNFSTLIILPTFLLVVFLLLFSLIGKKEITIQSIGEIQPTKIVSVIQSTSNNTIIQNNLKENKSVKKGEKLLMYDASVDELQLEALIKQEEKGNKQKQQLTQLKKNIEKGTTNFTQKDDFGYKQILEDYLANVEALKKEGNITLEEALRQNKNIENQRNALSKEMGEIKDKILDYERLKESIDKGKKLFQTEAMESLYHAYMVQLKQQKQSTEDMKKQILLEIQNTIEQLKGTNSSLNTQKESISGEVSTANNLSSRLKTLKTNQLTQIQKEMLTLNATLDEISLKMRLQKQAKEQSTLFSNAEGIIHLKEENTGQSKIPEGMIIAEIYPDLKEKSEINIVSYIPASQVLHLKEGKDIRFSIYQNTPKALILQGKITAIDSAAMRTKEGNVFKIISKATINKKNYFQIRYGLQGKVMVIVGNKSFFNYFKEKIFQK